MFRMQQPGRQQGGRHGGGRAAAARHPLCSHLLSSLDCANNCLFRVQVGVCGTECKTVERAAEQIMGEHDTDVAEALFMVRRLDEWPNSLELQCTAAKACT